MSTLFTTTTCEWGGTLLTGLAYFRKFGQPVNETLVKGYEIELERKLDGFERLLRQQKYIAGDVCLSFWSRRIADLHFEWEQSLTLADFYFLPYGEILAKTGYDYLRSETKWPNVARWWAEIAARPSWQIVKEGIPDEYSGDE